MLESYKAKFAVVIQTQILEKFTIDLYRTWNLLGIRAREGNEYKEYKKIQLYFSVNLMIASTHF